MKPSSAYALVARRLTVLAQLTQSIMDVFLVRIQILLFLENCSEIFVMVFIIYSWLELGMSMVKSYNHII